MRKILFNFFTNEHIILTVILMNAFIMFISSFYNNARLFEITDMLFTVFFIIEAIIKINFKGWSNYWENGWNKFDFIVLLIALPSLSEFLFQIYIPTNSIFVLRSLRIFKIFRLFKFIPNIKKLINGIKLALRASVLILTVFGILLLIFSILSNSLFGKILPEYFGNGGISLYTMFRLFSIEGWYEIPDAIAVKSSSLLGVFSMLFFSVIVFLCGIIGMSLITSIFTDSMAEDNNDEVMNKLAEIEKKIENITNID